MLLNLISPFTYEKRLNKLLENKKNEKKRLTVKSKPNFYNTARGFYRPIQNNDLTIEKEKESITSNFENEKKIVIERENMMTTTKEETV